jgi:transcriptional/translational regulatory protein YebC/TACO1
MEAAIRRGQGQSISGKPFENLTIEAVFPPGVAAIVECQTEGKLRTLTAVRGVITDAGGRPTPTQYLFDKRGRIVFKMGDVSADTLMETALEVEGFIDMVNEEDGPEDSEDRQISVITEANATKAVADAIVKKLGLDIHSLDVEWQPSTVVELQEEEYEKIQEAVQRLEEISEVQDIYLNI